MQDKIEEALRCFGEVLKLEEPTEEVAVWVITNPELPKIESSWVLDPSRVERSARFIRELLSDWQMVAALLVGCFDQLYVPAPDPA